MLATLALLVLARVETSSTTAPVVPLADDKTDSSSLDSRSGPYRIEPAVDIPIIGIAAALALIAFVEQPPAACLPDNCDSSRINGLDRNVLGNYSTQAHSIANILVTSLLVIPLLADLLDSGGDGYVEDLTVAIEAIALTQALTQLTKVAVRRNAPFVYNEAVPLDVRTNSVDATRSFFSGHTSSAFVAASQYATTFWLRHPDSIWRWIVLGAGAALATTVGILKIEAGYHYWTDIAAGAIVGTSVGVLVPLLHANVEL
jgi:membrane-associated phospholipid phosphatase